MLKGIILIIGLCFVLALCTLLTDSQAEDYTANPHEAAAEEEEIPPPTCDKYGWSMKVDDCRYCHAFPSLKLHKDEPYSEWHKNKPSMSEVREEDGELVMYYMMDTISDYNTYDLFEFAKFHKI
jgi:hypothetical protein